MDATAAIQFNLEALKRILAGRIAMAGLAGGAGPPPPCVGFEANLPIEPVA